MNYYYIVNRWAGAQHSGATWERVRQLLLAQNVQYELAVTEYPHHATQLAREFANAHATGWIVVAVGGDGTLLEVLEGLQQADNPVPLGYIPAGSGNDFARSVGIAREPYAALQQLLSATTPTLLDVGVYQNQKEPFPHYFSNNVGIGFDASIVYQANQGQKARLSCWHLESMAYLSAILKTLLRQPGFGLKITIDGITHEFPNAFVVSLTNIKYFGGGVGIAPRARLDDGKLDVVITEKLKFGRFVRLFTKLLKNGSHLEMPDVFFRTGREIHVQSTTPQHGQVNGEDLSVQAFDLKLWTTQQAFWFAPAQV
jgi:YegS/Rv2252/BmrU family lipid kinase